VSVRLALVDDHRLFRAALREILSKEPGLEIAGEAADAREAYQVVEDVKPDVAVVDISLRGVNGITVTRELVRREARCKVLILSMHSGEDFVAQALAAGASGYALKDQAPSELVEAIHAVASGRSYLCSMISKFVVDDFLRLRRGQGMPGGPTDVLSIREREVFGLLVRGYSNEKIAGELCISVKTVETHRAHILKKLNVHSMVELLRFAARHDLISD
jgi:DNA-binding NarL/FixJ family response regulator